MSIARTIALALCATLAAPRPAAEAAPTAAELTKDRAAAAERAFHAITAMHSTGRAATEAVCTWSVRWLDAAIEVAPRTAKQALADHLKRMTDLEAEVQKMFSAGTVSKLDVETAVYYRLTAELWVARGKR